MPVNNFRLLCQVADLNRLLLTLTHPEERTRNLTVIGKGLDMVFG